MDLADSSQRPSVLGNFNAVSSAAFIIGPLISGYLGDVDPTLRLSILTGACVYFANLFLVFFLLPPSKRDLLVTTDQRRVNFGFSFSWHQVFNVFYITKGLNWWEMKGLIFIRILATFSMIIFNYNFPTFMEESFSITNTKLGQILSYKSVTSALVSATCGIVAKWYPNLFKHVFPTLLLLFFSLLYIALMASNVRHILMGLSILSMSTAYLRICMVNLMLEKGRGKEGAVLGFTNSLSAICRMLAPTVVGVAQEYGSRTGMHLAAQLSLITVFGVFFSS